MPVHRACVFSLLFLIQTLALGQQPIVLQSARVFDGETLHEGWAVRVKGERIEAAGPAAGIDLTAAKEMELAGTTLLPGLAWGHSHIRLNPDYSTVSYC